MAMKLSKAELAETKRLKRKHGSKKVPPWAAMSKPKKKAKKRK